MHYARSRAILAALLAALLPPLMFPEVLFLGHTFYFMDLGWFHYPLRVLIADLWKAGHWPLWNPYTWNGFPLLAESAASALSPLNFPFWLPIASYQAFNLEILLHASIAGLSAFALARQVGVSAGGALLAALSYACGGYLMTQVICLEMMIGSAWAPLICALLLSAMERQRARDALLGGLLLALQIYSTHPQASYYTLVLLSALALYGAWRVRQSDTRRSWRVLARPFLYLAVIVFVGAGLSAPQITTGLELLSESRRAEGLAAEAQTYLSMPPNSFLTLIFPRLFLVPANSWRTTGIYDEFHFYLGLIPLVCVALALAAARRGDALARFSFLIVLATVILALGRFTPMYALVTQIPGLSFFRGPGRWLFITAIVLIVLVGKGADVFYSWLNDASQRPRLLRFGRTLTILYAALALTVPVAYLVRPPDVELLKAEDIFSIERMATRAQVASRLLPEAISFAVIAGLALIVFWLAAMRWRFGRAFAALALLITFGDLFLAGGELTADASYWEQARAVANFVQSQGEMERIFSAGGASDGAQRLGDAHPSLMRIFASSGEDMSQGLQRDEEYLAEVPFLRGLQLSSTRWLVVPNPLPARPDRFGALAAPLLPALIRVWESDRASIYAVPDPLPRAYVVYHAIPAASKRAAWEQLRAAQFVPFSMAVVEDAPEPGRLPQHANQPITPARLTDYAPERVRVEANAQSDGLLVLTDTDYPGWRAWVDGVEQPIVRTNFLFRGVLLSAGSHSVEFRYWPPSFQWGLGIALATALIIALAVGWRLVSRRS